jgi:hypothetical protein
MDAQKIKVFPDGILEKSIRHPGLSYKSHNVV